VEWNPTDSMRLNTWERVEGYGYFFATPYESVALAEYERVTNHEADTIPLRRHGFNLWFDGSVYHITQSK
jgi:hypothetical protein